MSETSSTPMPSLVACLCAEWCGVCREYRPRFEQLQARFPGVQFLWIDVEDEADLLHPLDVENFPTLLLAAGDQPRFFGTLTPQIETLERLIRSHLEDANTNTNTNTIGTGLAKPDLVAVLARVRAANPP